MHSISSAHALIRSQQRGIPPLIQDWLLDYGESEFDGGGGVIRYFSKRSLRNLERHVGKAPLRHLSAYLKSYLVESSSSGEVITVGKRFERIIRH